ncbi:MAG: DUF4190 domain-containing protein [Aeromicrobium sp.]|uniref:DUF4190 domain-containing protein n=1 Tax=Aeromicrobium sp. TaxID=1871063 RepID=UPI0039E34136
MSSPYEPQEPYRPDQPYGAAQPPPPQQPPGTPGYGYQPLPPEHPSATTAMVLGILGVALCQLIAPFGWWMGKKTMNEIDASGGTLGGRGKAQAGFICGIIGTVLFIISTLFLIVWFVIWGIFLASVESDWDDYEDDDYGYSLVSAMD